MRKTFLMRQAILPVATSKVSGTSIVVEGQVTGDVTARHRLELRMTSPDPTTTTPDPSVGIGIGTPAAAPYDPTAKQKAGAKTSRIPIKVIPATEVLGGGWFGAEEGSR